MRGPGSDGHPSNDVAGCPRGRSQSPAGGRGVKKRPSGTPRKPRAKHKKLQKAAPVMDGEQALLALPVEHSTRGTPASAPLPKVPVSAPVTTNALAGDENV